MRIKSIYLHTQYAIVVKGEGFGGLHGLLDPRVWFRLHSVGRNWTSSGKHWYGWNRQYRRLNIWPFSFWL